MDWNDLESAKGEVVGNYRLERMLGPDHCLALRLDDRRTAFFRRVPVDLEVRAGAAPHPSVLPIWDHGTLDETWSWLATPVLSSPTLDDLLEHGPFDPSRALRILRALATCLATLHQQGILLRDLRTRDVHADDSWQGADAVTLPPLELLRGRPLGGYCAPEVDPLQGDEVDGRADQFCLGVIGFELLTGTTPHNPEAPPGERTQMPVLPHPQIPEDLEPLFKRLLAPVPERRYPDDEALLTALEQTRAEDPVTTRGQFTPVIMPVRTDPPLRPLPPPLPAPTGNWDDTLALLVVLLIVFVTALAASTAAVLTWW